MNSFVCTYCVQTQLSKPTDLMSDEEALLKAISLANSAVVVFNGRTLCRTHMKEYGEFNPTHGKRI